MEIITIPQLSNRHVHLREDGVQIKIISAMDVYDNVLNIPNLKEPVDTAEKLISHKKEVESRNPKCKVTYGIMLTRNSTPDSIEAAINEGAKFIKIMFRGSTAGAEEMIHPNKLENFYPHLEIARGKKIPVLFHLELTETESGQTIREIDREKEAIPLGKKIIRDMPNLLISFEHLTTTELIEVVKRAPENVIGTLTTQHAILTYNMVCNAEGKIMYPELYCKPIAKQVKDKAAVVQTIIKGPYEKFRFGSDFAPHPWENKLKGFPGVFNPWDTELLVELFTTYNAIENLPLFASANEIDKLFYGWKRPEKEITLKKQRWMAPLHFKGMVPFTSSSWRVFQWQIVSMNKK